ncbi:efflux RND transporter permease subunit [Nitratidesulfovibrio vulgaris]|uniref:AcrB/AcrD/AcrF family protein n=1 Tax=Nitratidesulfovibrio vulgaris (strain ATCC 29579 / DSM 644 / CCUG 34227 / NCIMB 8303 / VKM B-1760 / Hildenborough) TaxID=882 RepID=Q72EY0_NITV2|nr:efflux RND transporter permease subunit [Nitratidesulfovibrio vulgaris]AAS94921.1 AcrB/AcrD/AcrF family protein [Nitratidesulfovibrio vulgaris str. Hildenborough]ADP85571.1 acriflavin resistance protein [Nitratidesulfovibrio vulgaris RCH1]
MNVTEFFIRRPVTTTLVMLGLLFFGVMGYRQLPVSDLPNVDFPTIQVRAQLPGADPETMASSVAAPLERQFATIAGIDSMSSTNTQGNTRITIQFNLSRDIDAAAQDVQAAISTAQRKLPSDLTTPPSYQKVNPADQPILFLALTSPTLPLSKVNEYAETRIGQTISMVSGVAQVNVYGAKKYAVRVQVDPRRLKALGLGIDEVSAAVDKANSNLPTGTLQGEHTASIIKASGQLYDAAAYRPVVVAYRNGAPVRLEELGRVVDSVEQDRILNWFNDERGIVLAVQRQPGTNTVEVVESIKRLLPEFERQLPAAVKLNILFDRSESIKASVAEVKFTLVLTVCLVVLVIFLFLRSLSATVIPSLALPMSVVVTFAAMHMMGFSLDNLSLMALTLAVGFVVDDAIVMLENIVRHMEMGKTPLRAALDGAREIGFTIISMTVSLAAVFIPVLFMGGIVGRLFHEFAVVITVAILLSGFVSLSLTPMLCALFLKPHVGQRRHGRVYNALETFFETLHRGYERSLRFTMRHHRMTFGLSMVVLGVTVWLFAAMPKGFLPSEDTGQISGFTEADQSVSFGQMVKLQKTLHPIIAADPGVDSFSSTVGAGGPNVGGNSGRFFIRLKDFDERDEHVDTIINRLRAKLSGFPGINVFLVNPPSINVGGRASKSLYQYTLQGPDTAELYKAGTELEAALRELPQLRDVTSDLQIRNPEVRVDIDRDKAAALGLSVHQVEDALQSAYGTRQVSTILAPDNDYQVILELLPEYQRDASSMSLLNVRSASGRLVPLDTIATLRPSVGPLAVNHSGQFPSVTLSFNLRPGVSLSEAVQAVEGIAGQYLPPTATGTFQGTAQAFQSSMQGMAMLLFMAVVVIYIVLGVLYESFIHPLTILSGLPSAGLGALVTLFIFGIDLNLYAFVGIIMLIGIVKKNAIMMIDFAVEAERKNGASPYEAILQGCLIRFRPIMMTTMAALMGTLPIAVGWGPGAEARQPLGLAVVGGLLVSQLLTLYITPVYYTYLDALSRRIKRRMGRVAQDVEAVASGGDGA